MSALPYVKFWPSDFLAGTSGLSPAERGVLITLLCLVWENDGPVERNDSRLARRCGLPVVGFQQALEALVAEGKIISTPEGLTNRRAEEVLADRRLRASKSKDAAEKRWRPSRDKTVKNQSASDTGALRENMRPQCHPEPEPEISTKVDSAARAREANAFSADFRNALFTTLNADPESGRVGDTPIRLGSDRDWRDAEKWRELGLTERDILRVVREAMARPEQPQPESFRYFHAMMRDFAQCGALPKSKEVQNGRSRPGRPSTIDILIAGEEIAKRL